MADKKPKFTETQFLAKSPFQLHFHCFCILALHLNLLHFHINFKRSSTSFAPAYFVSSIKFVTDTKNKQIFHIYKFYSTSIHNFKVFTLCETGLIN